MITSTRRRSRGFTMAPPGPARPGSPSDLCLHPIRIGFQGLAGRPGTVGRHGAGGRGLRRIWRPPERLGTERLGTERLAERLGMDFRHTAGAALRALTARKEGPSLYEVCDPLLLKYRGGDPHLGQFYRAALGNPALRPLLRRAGLAELRNEAAL